MGAFVEEYDIVFWFVGVEEVLGLVDRYVWEGEAILCVCVGDDEKSGLDVVHFDVEVLRSEEYLPTRYLGTLTRCDVQVDLS